MFENSCFALCTVEAVALAAGNVEIKGMFQLLNVMAERRLPFCLQRCTVSLVGLCLGSMPLSKDFFQGWFWCVLWDYTLFSDFFKGGFRLVGWDYISFRDLLQG